MAPTLPAMTRAIALAPSSPRRKDPESAAKRPSTDLAVPVAKSREVPPKRTKRKTPPPSAASPASPRLKGPPPNARPLERRATKDASIGPTALPAKNPEGNKRKTRPPPDTSGAMDPPAKRKTGQFQGKDALAPKSKTLDEMRLLYPYLVDEAMALVDQSVMERVLTSIDDEEAQALDKKVKRVRKKLAKAVVTSAGTNNMEMPTLFLFSSTKLQPEKLQHENENNILFDHLAKKDDADIWIEERLTRAEREIVELKQIMIVSQSQAKMESIPRHDHLSMKGRRCESAESGLQSIVAENQSPDTKIEVPNGLVHGKNGATSKYRCVVSRSVPRNNQQVHGMILPPFAAARGRPRKIGAKKSNSKQSECL